MNGIFGAQRVSWRQTPECVASELLYRIGIRPLDSVVDLGCGSGNVILAAASLGASCQGWDVDPAAVTTATERIRARRLFGACARLGDAKSVNLSGATVVFLYLMPEINWALVPMLGKFVCRGGLVVSHAYPIG